ncbi:NAD-dependent epimerase/dehydratase family protein [Phytohabitans sp. ZYX-F-186]|uniref:NAD-dependent epimerase/dehydratase family protein n=1 Tax=Phytohabitans maris TaxID=3071409 RepID=A0ABU0ZMF5_9ACTN|nr:NAD-dependent epimerase/dehydratase family protein [Phytohabitans sp. ZYX-F-186]MDQ7908218.1 NAD-dependent epimerase/dehydratase family protein [Phytohabitans sp. ZYX-F-186]
MRIVVTGADGFLGWHVRVLARALGLSDVVGVRTDGDPEALAATLSGAERVVHLAGVNRAEPERLLRGNVEPAEALAAALRRCPAPPKTVAFANSIQAGNGTAYGEGKRRAAEILAEATRWTGTALVDLRLPNLFGEHGRPHYNSVVATFCARLAAGERPTVEQDRELDLLHATDAARLLLTGSGEETGADRSGRRTVCALAERLSRFDALYRAGEIPVLADRFDVRLFNTYRSFCFPDRFPLPLPHHVDARGGLVESVKVHGGGGQTFCSTTRPGVTRGEHFHLAKVERFAVVRGEAEIALRRVLHRDVVRFRVGGDRPVAVDMPTMWAHSITNVGDGELVTLFWANEVFDPSAPDTYPEPVEPAAARP